MEKGGLYIKKALRILCRYSTIRILFIANLEPEMLDSINKTGIGPNGIGRE